MDLRCSQMGLGHMCKRKGEKSRSDRAPKPIKGYQSLHLITVLHNGLYGKLWALDGFGTGIA